MNSIHFPNRSAFALFSVFALLAALPARGDYASSVLGNNPLAYYRFNEDPSRTNINWNSGSIGPAGYATNLNVHPFPGGIAGDNDRSEFYDFSARSIIPWNAALNPTNTRPFTVEAWFYPASDQINGGQAAIMNRYSYSGVDRQGWVIFQRAQNDSYLGQPGYEGVGWNFRMYRGSGSSSGLDVVSGVPYQIGQWTHVVTVYDPLQVTNATLTMYINGVAAATNIWASDVPGYVANTDDHPPAEAVNGPAGISLGSYNNTQPGSNPYFGGIDEFALYPTNLTAAQILAHYQNGTNANRTTRYSALVQADKPAAYLHLDELSPGPDVAINMGDIHGVATHTAQVRHPAPGAIVSEWNDGSAAYHFRNGSATTTIPYASSNNPPASVPFTFESWLRPMSDRQGGQAPFNNRWVGGTGRTGWVVFQRNPNASYPASEGLGWNFRMYSGFGTSGQDVLTDTDYTIGQWQYLTVTWEPQIDMGDVGSNGNDQWQGILTAYINGVAVATNESALYAGNTNPTETSNTPADLAVGSYNATSGLGNNPYEGDVDEVALYNGYVLKAEQILAHYQAGTNAHPATNYATLVLNAASDGSGTQRLMPATYLRFNDPARFPATNSGTLGPAADGNLVVTTNNAAGPRPSANAGFESNNLAVPLNGFLGWVSLNNPGGLNISNQITLEAWIKPGTTQTNFARIISHGPPTLSSFLSGPPPDTNASVVVGSEVYLGISGNGANYTVGSSDGTNTYAASAAVPAGDLGSANWIHLAGTYDGANWKLFRNGTQIGSAAASIGALPVSNADWAVGSKGNGWEDNFAGGIDEVAIYNYALSGTQIQSHVSAGNTASVMLTITRSGPNVIIQWPTGTLEQSDTVNGQFQNVPNATAPSYTTTPTGTAKFYRVRVQ